MHLLLGALPFLLTILTQVPEHAAWSLDVRLVKDACIYEGKHVLVNTSLNLEHPCERWYCDRLNATHGYIDGIPCVVEQFRPGSKCEYIPRNGRFPACCPIVECNKNSP
ncbi:uncharacterized protein LOC144173636 [Haemaphysalis longicornis]